MLTRLRVNGFKNLVDVDIRFGAFTCIAGANAVGKSNLFDAIRFLSALADRPLLEAAVEVRAEGERVSDVGAIFHRVGEHRSREMRFIAEMVVPQQGLDDFNQPAEASITFLEYTLCLRLVDDRSAAGGGRLEIAEERLVHINQRSATRHLVFPHARKWRRSVVTGRRTSPFISTETEQETTYVKLHQEGNAGRPRRFLAHTLPRTVLSSANAAESPTALVARREMASWRQLQLEPSAMRAPDAFTSPSRISANGGHIPATLARLSELHRPAHERQDAGRVCARVANRLAELIENVRSIHVDVDHTRERYTLVLVDRDGTEHEARSLSDGSLRFLALAVLENDPEERGVLCFEEPENGIHPDRIEAMLELLQDLAVDVRDEVNDDNPLRQVIVNTHSPSVVQLVDDAHLVVAVPTQVVESGRRFTAVSFRPLSQTWRAEADEHRPAVATGEVLSYLFPVDARRRARAARERRVMDRPEFQLELGLVERDAS